jgi:hypothetical protein
MSVSRNAKSVKRVASILTPDVDEDAIDMAVEIVEAVLDIEGDRDQWALIARLDPQSPYLGVGTWTTKNQAMKAATKLVGSTPDREGTGSLVLPLKKPDWLDNI